ncbi:MAG TPA: uracil-DNA glycosylase [Pyrinomonadaceae bacterium]|nr:uracil-DNA glycosylase [Pyrinomonadaceae bacterium]
MLPKIPAAWRQLLKSETEQPYFRDLQEFLAKEYASPTVPVYPPENRVFAALKYTPYEEVNVLLLGQDPYHGANQANGLAFSVNVGVPLPPSLKNIFIELRKDVGCDIPNHGSLESWAKQGVLLLNAVLTVREGSPNSHKGRGWETFTDAIIRRVNEKKSPVVFVLWGNYAQKKIDLIDTARHKIVKCAHPSPLSARRFFGCRPFSQINAALGDAGKPEINWQIPNV